MFSVTPVESDKRNVDLEQVFYLVDLAPVGHKQDDVIIGLNDSVMMRHDDLVAAVEGAIFGLGERANLLILAAGLLVSLALTPWASAAALRMALE